jgi:hypothetical protein
MSGIPEPYRYNYVHVEGSQTDYPLGLHGKIGDYLHRVIVTLTTNNTGNVYIHDGTMDHLLVPNGTSKGVYNIQMNIISQESGWEITTSSAAEVLAVGVFTN